MSSMGRPGVAPAPPARRTRAAEDDAVDKRTTELFGANALRYRTR